MKRTVRKTVVSVGVGAVLVTSLAACGDSVVKQSALQTQVKEKLSAVSTQTIGAVKCNGDLTAKVKKTQTCSVDVAGSQKKVTVTVNSVSGKTVQYGITKVGW
ncbi:DUF4333 domain-containing protein [Rudaeicoccus suwonensis]|uniref:Uncharacterized protein DUF4333 n=1 Tax=Rudaeicoccus suwonensis TaxID=657409 RepID=A0A561E3D8_9MICO|nr:DUF4333 domain-containing protein [Rudaeicoccus suwonensis]TWE10128.1 uncharacterized protein DUF4333 [Rudaeicoccus suwonensis]